MLRWLLQLFASFTGRGSAVRKPVVEEIEPRILYSADVNPLLWGGIDPNGTAIVAAVDSGASTPPPTVDAQQQRRREIIFVDAAVLDSQTLVDALIAQRGGSADIEIVQLRADADGLAQIDAVLAGEQGIDALHIVSHGEAGRLQLGNGFVDSAALQAHAASLAGWQQALTADADILLFGCNVGEGAQGEAFIGRLAALTGADVAASVDATGASALGGDWDLEASTGAIEAAVNAAAPQWQAWDGRLDITTGLIGRWRFDANANDFSGNGYNGTLANGALIDTTAGTNRIGIGKLSLDGANDKVDLSASLSNFSALTQGTISAWIKTSDTLGVIYEATNTGSSNSYAVLGVNGGKLNFQVRQGGTDSLNVTTTASVNDNNWHHVAVTVGPSGNTLYIDGVAQAVTYGTGNAATQKFYGDVSGLNVMEIGVNQTSGGTFAAYAGLMDDVRFYNRALTGADVAQLAAFAGPGITVTPTVGLATTEAGGTAQFTVVLNDAPTATVTIPVSSSDTSEGTVSTTLLTFTTANWNVAQTVTVTGVNDALADGFQAYTAVLGAATSTDANYSGRDATDVQLANSDDDVNYGLVTVDTVADTNDGDTSSLAALAANRGADGFISLREAVVAANNTANGAGGADRIYFNIAGGGPHVINLTSALPSITQALIIDGSSEPDYLANTPVVRIDGASAGAGVNGISVTAGGSSSTIRGLTITRFTADGINVASGANNVTIAGNWIGTTGTGSTGVGNADDGLDIAGSLAIIGGSGANDRNVITNNADEGITIVGSGVTGHLIQGNYIGVDPDGASGGGNTDVGIAIISGSGNTIGGTTVAARNVISKNYEGIEVNTANNTILGNYIGTDAGGTLNRGNRLGDGIQIQNTANNTIVGGTAAGAGNLIAYNALSGVAILAGTGHQVLGNTILSNTNLGIELGTAGVTANDALDADSGANNLQNFPALTSANSNAASTTIVGTLNSNANTTYRIEYFANRPSAADATNGEGERYLGFITVTTDGSGNASVNTTLANVWVNSGDRVTATATVDLGGGNYGSTSEFAANVTAASTGIIVVDTTSDVSDGTTTSITNLGNARGADGRISLREAVIAANNTANGGTPDKIVFNIPVSDANHFYYRDNAVVGSFATAVTTTLADTQIADFDADYASGTARSWYRISLSGNYLDVTQAVIIDGSTQAGYSVAGGPVIEINAAGVTTAGDQNAIALTTGASTIRGLVINSAGDNAIEVDAGAGGSTIVGNYLGTDVSGTQARANSTVGTWGAIAIKTTNVVVGGATAADRNVISGNAGYGIELYSSASGSTVVGNYIGTTANGAAALGNTAAGVLVRNSSNNNTIGGTAGGQGNLIAHNGGDGIWVDATAASGNALLGNTIYSNSGQAIDLGAGGIAANDLGDGDTGPNALQNFPVLSSANANATGTTIAGSLNSSASTSYRIEFYANRPTVADAANGEGERYLGFINVTTDTSGNATISTTLANVWVNSGDRITATATNLTTNNTSEFGANVVASSTGIVVVDTVSDVADGTTTSIVNLGNARGADGRISLREAIIAANNTANGGTPDKIVFNIAGTGVHTITPTTTALPTITNAVIIDATTDDSFAANGNRPAIELSGSSLGVTDDGLVLSSTADGSTIRGLVIRDFGGDGIKIQAGADNNLIAGNYIGRLNSAGTDSGAGTQNGGAGVRVFGANNTIGGTTAADRNVLSGNDLYGVSLQGAVATGNTIAGNYIGLTAAGTALLGNVNDGVFVVNGASNNTIGGATTAHRNVIAGNSDGVQFGGTSGGANNNLVQNNYIGTDVTGTLDFGNNDDGIDIDNAALNNQVIGNLISGNTTDGIDLGDAGASTGTVIRGNLIGTQANGTSALGNSGHGILIGNASGTANDTTIGGTTAGQGNTISFNGGDGIYMPQSTSVSMLGNTIYGNAGLAIDLGTNGVTANDAGDADGGANNLQNFPVLASAATTGTQITIVGSLNSAANSYYRIEFYANTSGDASGNGEGQTLIGFANVVTDAAGNATFSATLAQAVPAGAVISATATRSDAAFATFTDTSEFAANVVASTNAAPVLDASKSPVLAAVNEDAGAPVGAVGTLVSALVDFASPAGQVDNVTDADSGAQLGIAVTAANATNGAWWYSTDNGTSWSALGAVSNANARLLAADANTRLYFQPNADYNGTTASAITFHAWDRSSGVNGGTASTTTNGGTTAFSTATDTASLTVTAVNDAPVVATAGTALAFTENGAATAVDSGLTVSDVDGGNLSSATVTISANFASGQDILAFTNQNGISGSWSAGSGVLTLTGSATVAQYQTALRSVTYINSSDSPSTATRTVSFVVNDGSANSNTATRNISVAAVNDAPTIGPVRAPFINEIHYDNTGTDSGEAIEITAAAGTDLTGWSLVLYNGLVPGAAVVYDTKALTGVVPNLNNGYGVLSFSYPSNGIQNGGNDAIALVNSAGTVVQFLSYEGVTTAADGPAAGLTSTDIGVAEDGTGAVGNSMQLTGAGPTYTWVAAAANSFGAVNAGQSFASLSGVPGTQTVAEDSALVFNAGNGNALIVGDPDADAGAADPLLVTVSVGNGTLQLGSTAGLAGLAGNGSASISFAGSVAEVNAALSGLRYQGNANFNGSDSLTLVVNDQGNSGSGGALQSSAVVALQVSAVNDAPLVATTGTTLAFTENGAATAVDSGLTVSDIDNATLGSATVSITSNFASGQDILAFTNQSGISGSWNAGSGVLTLTGSATVAQYQTALRSVTYVNSSDNPNTATRTVSFVVNDGSADSNTGTRNISVTAVNDAPAGADRTIAINEDTSHVFVRADFGFSDVDGNALQRVWIATLPAQGELRWNGATFAAGNWISAADIDAGLLTYVPAADANGTAAASFTFRVQDDGGVANGGIDQDPTPNTISFDIAAVNDAPVITSNGSGVSSVLGLAENTTAVTTVTSSDVDGGVAVYSIIGGADAARFTINAATGALAFLAAPDFEAPTDAGGDNVYDVTVQVADGAGGSDTQAIAVSVSDVSSALVVTTVADSNDTGLGGSFNAEQLNANKGADGAISLREALIAANNTTNPYDVISFNIAGAGVHTISVGAAALPTITGAVLIDGWSQGGFAGAPLIELSGGYAGSSVEGLTLAAGSSGSTVRGLIINRFTGNGIEIYGSGYHTLQGNWIGLDASGTAAAANVENGIIATVSSGNLIGGTSAVQRNVVSGNGYRGIHFVDVDGSTIAGNYIGTDASGSADVNGSASNLNQSGIVLTNGSDGNLIGGTVAAARNVISGNNHFGVELQFGSQNNRLEGNYIGTTASGMAALGNVNGGVAYWNAGSGNVTGGGAAGAGNVISGNGGMGILVGNASTGALIQGNTIGLGVDGSTLLGNGGAGVLVADASVNTLIGTDANGSNDAAERNVISGNAGDGVAIVGTGTTGTLVQGNRVGTNAAGTAARGNAYNGVAIYGGASGNTIGGTATGAGNLLSGNGDNGLALADVGTSGNLVLGNVIGLNAAQTAAIGNTNQGLWIGDGASGNTVGGSAAGAANIVGGNTYAGIELHGAGTSGNRIVGNVIGSDATGTVNFGNGSGVVLVSGAGNNLIGGAGAGAGNLIANSSGAGVYIDAASSGNALLGNSIRGNGGRGIDLGNDGVTVNDAGDADSGANGLQNFPVLASVNSNGGSTTIVGTINSAANTTLRIEFFSSPSTDGSGHGEGAVLLGFVNVTTDASGNASFASVLSGVSVAAGHFVSATATVDLGGGNFGDTSEFATNVVAMSNTPAINVGAISGNTSEGGGAASFTVSLATAPTADVTIAVASSNTLEGTASTTLLTFTSANWNIAQTVTVTGVDESIVDGDHVYGIVIGAASSADVAYNGLDAADVALTNTDNDTQSTIVVTTASDTADGDTSSLYNLLANKGADGQISLREAIIAANNSANGSGGADRIHFAIGGGGVQTIAPATSLPTLADALILDATTQAGYSAAAPTIVIDGALAGADANGLVLQASNSTVRGFEIRNFTQGSSATTGVAILIDGRSGGGDGNTIVANRLINNSESVTGGVGAISIAGAADNNLIDGNTLLNNNADGIRFADAGSSGNVITNNLIDGQGDDGVKLCGSNITFSGNTVSNSQRLTSAAAGIELAGVSGASLIANNVVAGGALEGGIWVIASTGVTVSGNTVSAALGAGIAIDATSSGITLTRNLVAGNAGLGIDLGNDGVTANDAGDADSGANGLQNFPVLSDAVSSGGNTTIGGTVSSTANTTLRIEFFSSPAGDASGHGEGAVFLGFTSVTTDAAGNASFSASLGGVSVSAGHVISATATVDLGSGNYGDTSEFSAHVVCHTPPANTVPAAQTVAEDTATAIGGIAVNDADGNLATVQLSVLNGSINVSLGGGAGLSAGANGSATLTLSGTQAQINAALASLSYQGAANYNGADTLTVLSTDALGATDSDSVAITVTAVDDAPLITSNGGGAGASVGAAENHAAVTTVTSTDVDGGAPSYSIAGGADAALFTIDAATGVLTFKSAPNFEAPADAGGNNVYDVTVQVADGNGGFDTQAIAVTVSNVNEAPVITSNAGGATATVSAAENQAAVTTVTSTDVDGGAAVYSIVGGADAALFTINAGTGVLTFNATPNFEAPADAGGSNVYDVTVQVADGNGGFDTQAIAVTVTNVNEAPVITSNAGGATATVSVAENQAAVTTVRSTDVDGGAAVYSIVGGADAALFTINAATGVLTFNATPNFEAPTDAGVDNVYDVTVQVADGNGGFDTQAIAVTVTNVNEAPTITSNGGGATANVTIAESQSAVTTITSADVDGGAPSYSIVGGADASRFTIDAATGALRFVSTPDFEAPVDANRDNVYDLVVSVADGNGGTDTQTIAVAVTGVNEAPGGIAPAAVSLNENAPAGTVVAIVTASDPDAGDLFTFTLVNDGGGRFVVDPASGRLLVAPGAVLDFESAPSQTLLLRVTDAQGLRTEQSIVITLRDVVETQPGVVPPGVTPPPTPAPAPAPAAAAPQIAPIVSSQIEEIVRGDTGTRPPAPPVALPGAAGAGPADEQARSDGRTQPQRSRSFADGAPVVVASVSFDIGGVAPGGWSENALDGLLGRSIGEGTAQRFGLFALRGSSIDTESGGDAGQLTDRGHGQALLLALQDPVRVASATLTAGFVWWLTRSGGLLTSILMGIPAWRHVDLLPVLAPARDDDEEEDVADSDHARLDERDSIVDEMFSNSSRMFGESRYMS
jgi:trimeric autotransporter adhesin